MPLEPTPDAAATLADAITAAYPEIELSAFPMRWHTQASLYSVVIERCRMGAPVWQLRVWANADLDHVKQHIDALLNLPN
jgi:hypothetical protein